MNTCRRTDEDFVDAEVFKESMTNVGNHGRKYVNGRSRDDVYGRIRGMYK